MDSVIDELKQRARMLHRALHRGDANALSKLRTLPELHKLADARLREVVQRRHCLTVLARELGLTGWAHLVTLWKQPDASDFGKLLYPESCAGGANIWCSSYQEARTIRREHGGFLLPYRSQMLIVDAHFIADLGLDPHAQEWMLIARDWIAPGDFQARHRLCRALLGAAATRAPAVLTTHSLLRARSQGQT